MTIEKKLVSYDANGNPVYEVTGSCLADDVQNLPTGSDIQDGGVVVVMDSGVVEMYDAKNAQWIPFGGEA